jgi:hypothetical protein
LCLSIWVFYALLGVYVFCFCFWIIVIEANGNQEGVPRVVEKWGELDSSKCVLAASCNDRKNDPVCVGCYKLFEFIEY